MELKFGPGIVVKLLRAAGWTSSIAKQLYGDAEVRGSIRGVGGWRRLIFIFWEFMDLDSLLFLAKAD
jgi:hypothetical protein